MSIQIPTYIRQMSRVHPDSNVHSPDVSCPSRFLRTFARCLFTHWPSSLLCNVSHFRLVYPRTFARCLMSIHRFHVHSPDVSCPSIDSTYIRQMSHVHLNSTYIRQMSHVHLNSQVHSPDVSSPIDHLDCYIIYRLVYPSTFARWLMFV